MVSNEEITALERRLQIETREVVTAKVKKEGFEVVARHPKLLIKKGAMLYSVEYINSGVILKSW